MNEYESVLNDYYSAIARIDCQHKKLLKAGEELTWHEGQLREADGLAKQLGVANTSALPVTRTVSYTTLERNRISSALNKARSLITESQNLQKNLESTRQRLSEQLRTTLNDLNKKLEQTLSDLKNNRELIEHLKTTRMFYVLGVVMVGVLTAIMTHNLNWTLIVIFIVLVVISFLDLE